VTVPPLGTVIFVGFVASVVQLPAVWPLYNGSFTAPEVTPGVPVHFENVAFKRMFDFAFFGAAGTGGVNVAVPPNVEHVNPPAAPAGAAVITPAGSMIAAASKIPETLRILNAPSGSCSSVAGNPDLSPPASYL
jgi:hypothetical protein